MANYGHVKVGRELTPEEVTEKFKEISDKFFKGNFLVSYGDNSWKISHKLDEDYAIWVELDDTYEYGVYNELGEWIEHDEFILVNKNSTVSFRHGHSHRSLWWVEGVFRENLAKMYNTVVVDDSDGIEEEPNPGKYESYALYCSAGYDLTKIEDVLSCKKTIDLHRTMDFGEINEDIIKELNLNWDPMVEYRENKINSLIDGD